MATLEQIIEEARKLSIEEQHRLRIALEAPEIKGELTSPGGSTSANGQPLSSVTDEATRRRRREWLKAYRDQYGGQYVVLDGDRLLAVGPTFRSARVEALAAGKPGTFITYLSKSDESAEIGGWV